LPNENADDERGLIVMSTKAGVGAPTRGSSDDEYYVLSFGDILRVLWQRLWIIALCAVTFMGAALGYSLLQTPAYEAEATVLIGQAIGKAQAGDAVSSDLSASDIEGLNSLTGTMATAVSTRRVAEAVIQEMDLSIAPEDILNNLGAQQIPETQFIQITYESPSPHRSQQIVNAVSEEFSRQVATLTSKANAVTATVWERAAVPDSPASPAPLRNGLLGLVLGAMLGVALAFVLENLDNSFQSVEEVERVSGVPALGLIPTFAVPKNKTEKVGLDGEFSAGKPSTQSAYE